MGGKKPGGTGRDCSVERTVEIFGDRWALLVLRESFFGARYYDDFQANLGISTNILSDRLRNLVHHQILDRRPDVQDGRRFSYRLTERGLDLYSVTLALMQWGDKWLAGNKGPPLVLTHRKCGHRLRANLCCTECGEPIDPRDVGI